MIINGAFQLRQMRELRQIIAHAVACLQIAVCEAYKDVTQLDPALLNAFIDVYRLCVAANDKGAESSFPILQTTLYGVEHNEAQNKCGQRMDKHIPPCHLYEPGVIGTVIGEN